jgi:hypothetical protein
MSDEQAHGNGNGATPPKMRHFLFHFGVTIPDGKQIHLSAMIDRPEPPRAGDMKGIAIEFAKAFRMEGRDAKSGAIVVGQPPLQVTVLGFQEVEG